MTKKAFQFLDEKDCSRVPLAAVAVAQNPVDVLVECMKVAAVNMIDRHDLYTQDEMARIALLPDEERKIHARLIIEHCIQRDRLNPPRQEVLDSIADAQKILLSGDYGIDGICSKNKESRLDRKNCVKCMKKYCRCCDRCGNLGYGTCSGCHYIFCKPHSGYCCDAKFQIYAPDRGPGSTPLHPKNAAKNCDRCAKAHKRCRCCFVCGNMSHIKCGMCTLSFCGDRCLGLGHIDCPGNFQKLAQRGPHVEFESRVAQVGVAEGGLWSLPERAAGSMGKIDAVCDSLNGDVAPRAGSPLDVVMKLIVTLQECIESVSAGITAVLEWMKEHLVVLGLGILLFTPIGRWGVDLVINLLQVVGRVSTFVADNTLMAGLRLFLRLVNGVQEASISSTVENGDVAQVGFDGSSVIGSVLLLAFVKNPEMHVMKVVRYIAPTAVAFTALGYGIETIVKWLPEASQEWLVSAGFVRPVGELSREYGAIVLRFMGMYDRASVTPVNELDVVYKGEFCALRDSVMRNLHVETAGKSSGCSIMVAHLIRDSLPLYTLFKAHVRTTPRQQTTAAVFYGPGGGGKSSLAMTIATLLCPSHATFNAVWTRTVGDRYWSGYACEEAIVYDDISQGAGTDRQDVYAELIRLLGPVPFRPVMAGVEDKGRLAEPNVVIATTNDHPSVRVDGINMLGFRRRFLHFFVTPVRAYTKNDGSLDEEKVSAMPQKDRLAHKHLEIVQVTFDRVGKVEISTVPLSIVKVARMMQARAVILNETERVKAEDLKALRQLIGDDLANGMINLEPEEAKALADEDRIEAELKARLDRAGELVAAKNAHADDDERKAEVGGGICFDCVASGVPECGHAVPEVVSLDDVKTAYDPILPPFIRGAYVPDVKYGAFIKQVFEMSFRSLGIVSGALTGHPFIGAAVVMLMNGWSSFCYACLKPGAFGSCMCLDCISYATEWATGRCRRYIEVEFATRRLAEADLGDLPRRSGLMCDGPGQWDPEDQNRFVKYVFEYANPLSHYCRLCKSVGIDVNASNKAIIFGFRRALLTIHPDKGGESLQFIYLTRVRDRIMSMRERLRVMSRSGRFYPFLEFAMQRTLIAPVEFDIDSWDSPSAIGSTLVCNIGQLYLCECGSEYSGVCAFCDDRELFIVRPEFSVKMLLCLYLDMLPPNVREVLQPITLGRTQRIQWIKQVIRGLVGIANTCGQASVKGETLVETNFIRLARVDPEHVSYLVRTGVRDWQRQNGLEVSLDTPFDPNAARAIVGYRTTTDKICDELACGGYDEDTLAREIEQARLIRTRKWYSRVTFDEFIERAKKFLRSPNVVDTVKVFAVVGTLYTVYRGAKYLIECFSGEVAQNGSNQEDGIERRHDRERLAREKQKAKHLQRQVIVRKYVIAQSGTDEATNSTVAVLEKIANNMVIVERAVNGGSPYRINGVFIRRRVCMLPRHFFRNPDMSDIVEGSLLVVKSGSITFTVPFKKVALIHARSLEDSAAERFLDVCFYDFSTDPRMLKSVVDYPSIVSHFASSVITDDLAQFGGFLLLKSSSDMETEWVPLPEVTYEGKMVDYGLTVRGARNFYAPSQYKYLPQNKGDCGSLLIGVGRSLGGAVTILGHHALGRTWAGRQTGVALPLDITMLIDDGCEERAAEMWIEEVDGAYKGGLSKAFVVLARSVVPRMGALNTKSSYVESPIARDEMLSGVDRQPSLLGDPADLRSTLLPIELLEKELNRSFESDFDQRPFFQMDVELIGHSLLDDLDRHYCGERKLPCRKLTLEEALNGASVPGFDYLKPMAMSTSSGWPWCTMPGVVGKRPMISGVAGTYEVYDIRLKRRLIEVWIDCLRGRLFSPVVVNNKSELRSPKKIVLEQTRGINCFQLEHQITMRQVFGAFVNYMHSIHTDNTSAVGMDVHSADWDMMLRRWTRVGVNGFDGDVQKFERYMCKQLVEMVLSIVDEWYRRHGGFVEEESTVRRALVGAMTSAILIVDNRFVKQPCVLLSGIFGTTVIFGNLMCQFFLRKAWLDLARVSAPRLIGMCDYERHVQGSVYGDDNACVVSDKVGDWYNAAGVSSALLAYGVVYTPADKDGDFGPNRHYLDLQFLKLRTVVDERFPGRIHLAVPERKDVLSSLRWITNSMPPPLAVVVNANACLRRCFGWRRDVWENFRLEILKALTSVGIVQPLVTWSSLLNCDDIIRDIGAASFAFDVQQPITFEHKVELFNSAMFLSRVTPLNRIRREIRVAQMFAPSELVTTGESEKRYTLGVGGGPVDDAEESCVTENTKLGYLARRRFVRSAPIVVGTYNSHTLWSPNPDTVGLQRAGALYFWSMPFAHYQGSLDVQFLNNGGIDVNWNCYDGDGSLGIDPTALADWGVTGAITGTLMCGFGNSAYLNPGPALYNTVNLPSLSRTRLMNVPRFGSNYSAGVGTGLLTIATSAGTTAPSAASRFLVGAGPDMKFYQCHSIPRIRFYASGFVDERVAQMDGVKSDAPDRDLSAGGVALRSSFVNPDLKEIQQSFVSMAEDWAYVEVVEWNTSHGPNHVLKTEDAIFYGQSTFNRWAWDAFVYFRGDVHYKVQLDSNQFQSGKILVGYTPALNYADVGPISSNFSSMSFGQNVAVYAGGPREVVLEIPWFQRFSCFNLYHPDGAYNAGIFWIIVQNPLVVGVNGATTADLTIYASYKNAHFSVRRNIPDARDKAGKERKRVSMRRALEDEKDDFERVAQGGQVSRLASTTYHSVSVGTCGTVNFAGLGRAQEGPHLSMFRNEGSRGDDDPGYTIGTLTRRPGFFTSVVLTSADVTGSVLKTLRLTIAPVSYSVLPLLVSLDREVTSMEYASIPFDQWRCKRLCFRFEVVGTRFHIARLGVVTRYAANSGTSASVREAMSQYAQIFDVGDANNVHDICVPWVMDREWLQCPKREPVVGYEFLFSYGSIEIVVLNQLKIIDAVADEVNINIYLWAEGVEFRGASIGTQLQEPLQEYG
jgi:hypothetical protein